MRHEKLFVWLHAHTLKRRIVSSSQRSPSKSELPADIQQSSQSATCSTLSPQQRSPFPPHLQQNRLNLERQLYSGSGRGSNWFSPHISRSYLPHRKMAILGSKKFVHTICTDPKAKKLKIGARGTERVNTADKKTAKWCTPRRAGSAKPCERKTRCESSGSSFFFLFHLSGLENLRRFFEMICLAKFTGQRNI